MRGSRQQSTDPPVAAHSVRHVPPPVGAELEESRSMPTSALRPRPDAQCKMQDAKCKMGREMRGNRQQATGNRPARSGAQCAPLYAMRKETIERVFADAKENHAMRYTHHRGLARVTGWVRLKYVAMNLKKLANWSWNNSFLLRFFSFSSAFCPVFQS